MPARQGTAQAATPGLEYKAASVADAVGADAGVIGTDDETGVVEAIVSVTGVYDHDGDLIEPGAYASTLTRRRPKGIFSHDWKQWASRTEAAEELMPGNPRLAEYAAKTGKTWPTEAGGLYVRTRYNLNTPEGRSAYENVKFFGPECEWSIGYRVPPGKAVRSKDGRRRIREIDLFEYSPVLFGAASLSGTLSVKSAHPGGGDGGGGDGQEQERQGQEPAVDDADSEAADLAELAAAMDALSPGGDEHEHEAEPGDEPETEDTPDEEPEIPDGGPETAPDSGEGSGPDGEPEDAADDAPEGKWDVQTGLLETAVAELDLVAADLGGDVDAKRDFSPGRRRAMAKDGTALPDGSYPIKTVEDLRNAISAYGRANPQDRAKVRAHIIRRARALGHADLIPEGWSDGKDGRKALGHVSLDRSPRKNWVEMAGQLPAYIQHIARDLHDKRGMPLSRAIPTAIAAVKRWAAGGGNVQPETRAKAAAAVAEWEALKARSHARTAGRKNDDIAEDPTEGAAGDTARDMDGWLQMKAVLSGSLEEFRDELQAQIAERIGGEADTVELLGTWPDRVVAVRYPHDAEKAAETFEVGFEIGDGGAITLSVPEPVTVTVDDGENSQIAGADLGPFPAMVETVTGAVKALLAVSLGDAETKSGGEDGNGVETKAGRVLSGVNATRLKAAVENLVAVLKAAGIEINGPREPEEQETEPQETDSTAPSMHTGAVPEGKVLVDPAVHARALRILGDVHAAHVHADG